MPQEPLKNGREAPALRVLVAEDNPLNREVLRGFLIRQGCLVSLAEHGAEAVEMARSQAFDLILMDIQMPVMDGIEAMTRIRLAQEDLPPERRPPIVALTAYGVGQEVSRIKQSGFDLVLTKPLDFSELFEMLKGVAPIQTLATARLDASGTPIHVLLRGRFLDDTPPRLLQAREMLARKDLDSLQALAHYLVNSALAVKEKDMEIRSRVLEAACIGKNPVGIQEALEQLANAIQAVSIRFEADSTADSQAD